MDEVREILQQEYIRQIQATETAFEAESANNIQVLQQILQRREEMIGRYASIFETAYESTTFQDILQRKRDEIEALLLTTIEGFIPAYEIMIDSIANIDEATRNQFKQLPRLDQYNTA
jgi:hypothetical protein